MARLTITLAGLKASLGAPAPPAGLPPTLIALWHDAKGDWDAAHKVAQDIDSEDGAWIHAYLHRKEGDDGNAAYWYRRAGKQVSTLSLDAEWDQIVGDLISRALA
jgi:hypothetical protein